MSQSIDQQEIARCNRCGFCQTACPVFRATGHETGVARGRIALLKALQEGRLEWSGDLEDPLFTCLLCGACTAHCFPGVETADMMVAARQEYQERVGRKRLHRLLFEKLLPYPSRVRLAARMAALGKASGLSKVAKALGLLRVFGRDLSRAEGIIERFPAHPLREKGRERELTGEGELRVGYFVGCGMDIMCPDAAEATLGHLRKMARTVRILDNCCCGLPADTYGDRDAARRLARQNLELIGTEDFDLVVTDCSSCAAYLKKYPALLPEDGPAREAAEWLAAHARDVVEVLTSAGAERTDGEKLVVTYHDPCHAARGQGLTQEPRDVLRSLPGVEFRELPEADWCCGGAGSYALSHYDISQRVLDRKLDNIERTGADVVVTSCPACIIQLSHGIRKRSLPIRVRHITEMVAAEAGGALSRRLE